MPDLIGVRCRVAEASLRQAEKRLRDIAFEYLQTRQGGVQSSSRQTRRPADRTSSTRSRAETFLPPRASAVT